jgi:glycosyltransferase involved in cell wall biosynthesis
MSAKLKILLFTDWYEPGFKAGGPIQSCKNIVNTLQDVYDFHIFTSDRDLNDDQPYPGIVADQVVEYNGVKICYASPSLGASLLKRILTEIQPQVIYFNSMYSFKFTLMPLYVLNRMRYKGRVVLAPRGMLHKGAMKRKSLKKKVLLRSLALAGTMKNIYFHATDTQESKDISRHFRSVKGIITASNIPNFDNTVWKKRAKSPGLIKVVFISRIHPKKNLDFALLTLEKLSYDCIVEFNVYGLIDDAEYFNKCRSIASRLNSNVRVNFKGPVHPSEIFAILHDHHLFFLPTLGENFGHAIFEALSAGCPVLISDQTPWQDLNEHNAGWSLPLARPDEFITKVRDLCRMDTQAFNAISADAKKYAENYFQHLNIRQEYASLFG